jgi:cytochrome c-type biogenesis protein CcmH/NrfG
MEPIHTRREKVVVAFFSIVAISVIMLTGYRLLADGGPKHEVAHQEDQSAALVKRAADLEASLRTKPEDVRTMVSLGDTYLELRDSSRALPLFEKAERIAPGDAHVQMDLGSLYLNMGRSAAALEKYERAFALAPNNGEVLLNIAAIYGAQGNRDKARGALQALLATNAEPSIKDAGRKLLAKIEATQGYK